MLFVCFSVLRWFVVECKAELLFKLADASYESNNVEGEARARIAIDSDSAEQQRLQQRSHGWRGKEGGSLSSSGFLPRERRVWLYKHGRKVYGRDGLPTAIVFTVDDWDEPPHPKSRRLR